MLAAGLVTIYIAQHSYSTERTRILHETSSRVLAQPQLQLAIYYHDYVSTDRILSEFLSPPAVQYVAVYDTEGARLAERQNIGSAIAELPDFETIREGISPLNDGISQRPVDLAPAAGKTLALLTGGEQILDQTIPVFSAVDPNEPGKMRSDFSTALTAPGAVDSFHLMGYVHLGISRSLILKSVQPFVIQALLVSFLLVILCAILIYFLTRQITTPLSRLALLADAIASGNLEEFTATGGGGEIKKIATTLTAIVGGLSTYKSKMDVDKQLLSMKVDERTSQLSQRNDELSKALAEVTDTKDKLRKLAYFDSLTALPNRRLFTEQLRLLLRLTARNDEMLALLFLDLDNFKRINDSLGHSVGDLLLRAVATRLRSCIRDSDVVAHYITSESRIDVSRLGGDEFTIVLNQVSDADAAGVVAQRVIDAMLVPISIDGHELVVSTSIGITVAPLDGDNIEDLLKGADTAMYHAKSKGGNRFSYYRAEMDAASIERLKMESDLRAAIEREELELHYQPQVDALNGSVIGAEALVRWNHPEQGMIPPFKFVPLAEEMGLIIELGDWVMMEACRQLIEFRQLGLDLPKIAVNVSALQFNATFVERVEDVLRKTGLQASSLELELTEGVVLEHSESVASDLNDLKNLGVSLSIDDFGTGYSSLSYLSRFPLDELKIDRSFVVNFDKSENSANLVIAIIAMGNGMNLKLVAEGVETHEEYRFLVQHGVRIIQGYLFSKPVPAKDLKNLLAPYFFINQINIIKAEAEIEQGASPN
jgi:diguanylate cyclase (GGDEF)-like protein